MAFMLASENIQYSRAEAATLHVPKSPMILGGLNMQWVLFAIATLEITPLASKRHARNTLLWFGAVLGIGQAKVLAHVSAILNLLL